jgi:hypothetical protein
LTSFTAAFWVAGSRNTAVGTKAPIGCIRWVHGVLWSSSLKGKWGNKAKPTECIYYDLNMKYLQIDFMNMESRDVAEYPPQKN